MPLISSEGGDLACLKFSLSLESCTKTDFFAGSFDGEIVHADWTRAEGVEHPDHTKSIRTAHAGGVVELARSPFFDDVIVSVGDWTFRIWKEGHEKPLFVSPYAQGYYVAGANKRLKIYAQATKNNHDMPVTIAAAHRTIRDAHGETEPRKPTNSR